MLTDLPYFFDKRHHIVLGQGIMQCTYAQDKTSQQNCPVHKRFAAFLYLFHDFLVQGIKLFLIPS
jgi:hypothetical protein